MNSNTNVIDIKGRLPKMTTDRLVKEAKENSNDEVIPIETLISDLPFILVSTLDFLLDDFNYLENKQSNLALSARILASCIQCLNESLENIE